MSKNKIKIPKFTKFCGDKFVNSMCVAIHDNWMRAERFDCTALSEWTETTEKALNAKSVDEVLEVINYCCDIDML